MRPGGTKTHRDAVAVPAKALYPLVLLNIPYAHAPILSSTREVLPIRAQGEGPDFVRVAVHVADVAQLAFSFLINPDFVKGMHLTAGAQVPLDDGPLLACSEEPAGVGRCDGSSHRKAVGTFCAQGWWELREVILSRVQVRGIE